MQSNIRNGMEFDAVDVVPVCMRYNMSTFFEYIHPTYALSIIYLISKIYV